MTFLDESGETIASLPVPEGTVFRAIISKVPISEIVILEDADDGDDVSYDNLIFGLEQVQKVTGFGCFENILNYPEGTLGDKCCFGVIAVRKGGDWKGWGVFIDKDFGLVAILKVKSGGMGISRYDGSRYVRLEGTARLYINNRLHHKASFTWYLVDAVSTPDRTYIIFYENGVMTYRALTGPNGLIFGEIAIH